MTDTTDTYVTKSMTQKQVQRYIRSLEDQLGERDETIEQLKEESRSLRVSWDRIAFTDATRAAKIGRLRAEAAEASKKIHELENTIYWEKHNTEVARDRLDVRDATIKELEAKIAEAAGEKPKFTVTLTDFGNNKITAIKIVRAVTGLGLKDAKAIVDSAPAVVRNDLSKEEAVETMAWFDRAGVTVEIS